MLKFAQDLIYPISSLWNEFANRCSEVAVGLPSYLNGPDFQTGCTIRSAWERRMELPAEFPVTDQKSIKL